MSTTEHHKASLPNPFWPFHDEADMRASGAKLYEPKRKPTRKPSGKPSPTRKPAKGGK